MRLTVVSMVRSPGRLQVERHARDAVHRLLQAAYHRLDAVVAFIQRLEVDLQTGAVQRRVGAVDADEGGQTLNCRILRIMLAT